MSSKDNDKEELVKELREILTVLDEDLADISSRLNNITWVLVIIALPVIIGIIWVLIQFGLLSSLLHFL